MTNIPSDKIIRLMLDKNSSALYDIEQAAIKNYSEKAPVDHRGSIIAQAWIRSIIDHLEVYYLGVYQLNAADSMERTQILETSGIPNIIAFRKK